MVEESVPMCGVSHALLWAGHTLPEGIHCVSCILQFMVTEKHFLQVHAVF